MNDRTLKIILYIAISRDGYIADKDGGVAWLDPFNMPDEDYGYAAFLQSIDTIIMGKNTYEQMLTFGPWQYTDKTTYVLTDSSAAPIHSNVIFTKESPDNLLQTIAFRNPKSVIWLCGGAHVAHNFHVINLIDEYVISIIPVDLNEGIALNIDLDLLKVVSSKSYANGVEQKTYIKE